jgi:hypothetical protein
MRRPSRALGAGAAEGRDGPAGAPPKAQPGRAGKWPSRESSRGGDPGRTPAQPARAQPGDEVRGQGAEPSWEKKEAGLPGKKTNGPGRGRCRSAQPARRSPGPPGKRSHGPAGRRTPEAHLGKLLSRPSRGLGACIPAWMTIIRPVS